MPLSVMRAVDDLIDEDGRNPIATELARRSGLAGADATFFRSSANFIYRLRSLDGEVVLRFAAGGERERSRISSELDVIEALRLAGARVAGPLGWPGGEFVETIETDQGVFHGVLFRVLQGPTGEEVDLDDDVLATWGAALGRLHVLMEGLPTPVVEGRPAVGDLLGSALRDAPGVPHAVREEAAAMAGLAGAAAAPDGGGLIHGDFQLDNLIWTETGIGILDFDDCARGPLAMDVALALLDLVPPGAGPGHAIVERFVEGYRTARALPPETAEWLADWGRLARLVRHLRLVRAVDVAADGLPPWLADLRSKLLLRIAEYEAQLSSEPDRSGSGSR